MAQHHDVATAHPGVDQALAGLPPLMTMTRRPPCCGCTETRCTGGVGAAIIRVEGNTTARLSGGDFAAIRASVTGERVTPVGQFQDWVSEGRSGKSGDTRAA